jgi:glucosylceramidase
MQFVPESTGQTSWTQIAANPEVTDQAWTVLAGEYSPPEPAFQMQFYAESPDETAAFYLDGVTVTMIEPPPDVELPSEETGSVDFGADLQHLDGFGFSQAFQRAAAMNGLFGLTPEHQQEVLDLLLNPETGAGFSILRLGIGSSVDDPYDLMKSIQPADPGGPDAEPQYEWDGYDGGQVWLARHAQAYGVDRFYADAWSAPGYVKTNGDDANGGVLCGVPGTDCPDWRQAYADYLLQYVRFYAGEGIELTDLGFTNEPDLTVPYASMRFDHQQALDFINVLGPTIEDSELDVNLVCCDLAGWNQQAGYTEAIEADPQASQWVDVHSGHSYVSPARAPLPTGRPAWMSEYALPSGTWVEAWDGNASSGLALANDIHDTLVLAEANAYVSWFGASLGGTAAPIQLDGPDYHVAKRLWATAAYSRFVRPGAFRVAAETSGQLMKISGYRNADGGKVVNLINNRESAVELDLALDGLAGAAHVVTHRTDAEHSLARVDESIVTGPELVLDLPPRSLTTLVLTDCTTAVTGERTARLAVDSGVTCLAEGARIDGPVTVSAGASLVATGATISGLVSATGAATVRLVGSTMTAPVSVSGTTDRVLIAGSRLTGPVSVSGAATGFAPVLMSGNTVRGTLACEGNSPAPTNEGIPNTVTGPATGQCRDL